MIRFVVPVFSKAILQMPKFLRDNEYWDVADHARIADKVQNKIAAKL